MRLDAARPYLLPGGEPSLKGNDETQHLLVQLAAKKYGIYAVGIGPPKIHPGGVCVEFGFGQFCQRDGDSILGMSGWSYFRVLVCVSKLYLQLRRGSYLAILLGNEPNVFVLWNHDVCFNPDRPALSPRTTAVLPSHQNYCCSLMNAPVCCE